MNNHWTPLYLYIAISLGYWFKPTSTRQQLLETAQVQVVEYPRVFHRPPLATGCLTRWMSTRADRSEAVFRGLPVFRELSTSKAVEVYHHLVCSHMVKQPSMVDQPVTHHAGMTRTDESCVLATFPSAWGLHIRVSHITPFFELSLVLLTTYAIGLYEVTKKFQR